MHEGGKDSDTRRDSIEIEDGLVLQHFPNIDLATNYLRSNPSVTLGRNSKGELPVSSHCTPCRYLRHSDREHPKS
jgi:hypothetical protein